MKSRATILEDFKATIRSRKAYLDMTDAEIAAALEVSRAQYSRHKQNPMDMSVEELRRMVSVLHLPAESVLAVLGYK